MRDRSPQAGRDDLRGVLFGLAVLAALGLLDLSLNPATNFATALVMAPVLCAALARPQAVAAVGALAVVGAGLLVAYDAHVGAPGVKVGLVAAGTVLAILISRDRLARAARLARVVSVAEAAQRALLPDLAERVGPAVVAAWYVSATQEALIGGDFYDVTGYQQSARWVIGDVKGKGIEAIRMTAAVLGAFREAAVRVGTLREVAVRIDERVSSLAAEEDFVTALVGELSPDGAVRLINCGHPPPLRLTPGPLVPMTATAQPAVRTEPRLQDRSVPPPPWRMPVVLHRRGDRSPHCSGARCRRGPVGRGAGRPRSGPSGGHHPAASRPDRKPPLR